MTDLNQLQSSSLAAIASLTDLEELNETRVKLLGKSGEVTGLLKTLGTLPAEQRKEFGQQVNLVKVAVQEALDAKKETLETQALNAKLASETVDVTLPSAPILTGKMHPISYVIEEVGEVLARLGFTHVEGTEISSSFDNFTALNIPEEHPARQDHDTFYLKQLDEEGNPKLLRTQTSNVQTKAMQKFGAPLRIMSIGRVYRCDSDLTHTPQFHQVEGLALAEDLTFGHLKGTLQRFLAEFFEKDVNIRLRPSYFPFTEPSAEVDMECIFCSGKGCRVCSHTGWLEVLGSGMVHRNVLKHGGIDHEKYQGFAFGAGIERLAMLKYGINDLRMFFESHAAFLRHFGKSSSDVRK